MKKRNYSRRDVIKTALMAAGVSVLTAHGETRMWMPTSTRVVVGGTDVPDVRYGRGASRAFSALSDTVYPYLTMTAQQDGSSVTFSYASGTGVQYRTNGGKWVDCPSGTTVTLDHTGDFVQYRGIGVKTDYNKHFSMAGSISASGDVTSLANGIGGDVAVPAYGYVCMFIGCAPLARAPNLPSTVVGDYGYEYMFSDCEHLTEAPELPATALSSYCYHGMFSGCTSLKVVHDLPAKSIPYHGYDFMFHGCSALVTAPAIYATQLSPYSCATMFARCRGLKDAPELRATVLSVSCYSEMFYYCTSLEVAPYLRAETLTSNCYSSMFYGCTSLKNITTRQSNFSGCSSWLKNTAESAMINCTADLETALGRISTRSDSNVPSGWTVARFNGDNYLTLTAQQDGSSVTFSYGSAKLAQYRVDGGKWVECPSGTSVTIDNGQYVQYRGIGVSTDRAHHFSISGKIAGSGSVTSLTDMHGTYSGVTTYYYAYMFYECSALTSAPELPALTLSSYCYEYMFSGCTGLTESPLLPASPSVTEFKDAYTGMFSGCTNLSVVSTRQDNFNGCLYWLDNVRATGVLRCTAAMRDTVSHLISRFGSTLPEGWTVAVCYE